VTRRGVTLAERRTAAGALARVVLLDRAYYLVERPGQEDGFDDVSDLTEAEARVLALRWGTADVMGTLDIVTGTTA